MKRRTYLLGASAALVLGSVPATVSAQDARYPADSIRIIVPFDAGGGTDAVARMVASGLNERLGIPVNVENRPGAAGIIGHRAIADAEPDGSTIGLLTSSLDSYETLGRGEISYEDFTPVALVNFDPAGVQVQASSEFENLQQAIEALKENPGDYTASASGIGGPWHVAWVKLMQGAGLEPDAVMFVPSDGAGPSLNELIAGGVDFAPTSVAEARSLIEAGDVRSLAVMSDERIEAFPDVPTVEEAIGEPVTAGVWRGFAGPEGMSEEAASTLTEQIEDIFQSEEFRSQMSDLGYGLRWAAGEDFRTFMEEAFNSTKDTLTAAGLAKE